MAAKLLAKYRVDADPPGIQITGSGEFFDGASVAKPGTILNLPQDFEPRASLTPLNKVAEDAFAKKRKKVEAQWRACLPKGQNPDGQPLEVEVPKDKIEEFVQKQIAKVGPRARVLQRDLMKRAPRLSPNAMRVEAAEPDSPEDADEDSFDDKPTASGRASDSA